MTLSAQDIGTYSTILATLVVAAAGYWKSNRKDTADFAANAFTAWEALANRQAENEKALMAEISELRKEIEHLRGLLAAHGIPNSFYTERPRIPPDTGT